MRFCSATAALRSLPLPAFIALRLIVFVDELRLLDAANWIGMKRVRCAAASLCSGPLLALIALQPSDELSDAVDAPGYVAMNVSYAPICRLLEK